MSKAKKELSAALYDLHYTATHIKMQLEVIAKFKEENKSKYVDSYLYDILENPHNHVVSTVDIDKFLKKYPRTLWTDKNGSQQSDKINLRGRALRKARSDYYYYSEKIYAELTRTESAIHIIEYLLANPELTIRKK